MSIMRYPKLELKITELVEVKGLTRLVGLVEVRRLRANRNKHFNKTTGDRQVGRADCIRKTRGKRNKSVITDRTRAKKAKIAKNE